MFHIFLNTPRPPLSTATYTLFPHRTLLRSARGGLDLSRHHARARRRHFTPPPGAARSRTGRLLPPLLLQSARSLSRRSRDRAGRSGRLVRGRREIGRASCRERVCPYV